MGRPKLLDLFCGAGGCAMGYHRAGFEVVGVDHRPQPRFPFHFVQADALEYLEEHGREYACVHASPPCQRYSRASFTQNARSKHPDLLATVRSRLQEVAFSWVIENVDGAPVLHAVQLCGLMFGLKVFRHRWLESSHLLIVPNHPSHKGKLIGKDGMCCVVGHGGGVSRRMRSQAAHLNRDGSGGQQTKAEWAEAMGIDWMTRNELSQAIPPAYMQFIGAQLMRVVQCPN